MIIKRRISSFLAFAAFALSAGLSHAAPPSAITSLQALTGMTEGSIDLTWTAPSGPIAYRYEVRYKAGGVISNNSDFDVATLYPNPPAPVSPGGNLLITITGLTKGATYGFAVKSADSGGTYSVISNTSTAVAKDVCVQTPNDGEGTVSVASSTIKSGMPQTSTITFVVGAHNIGVGGFIQVRIPGTWQYPQRNYSFASGYVPNPTSTSTAVLDVAVSNQLIIVSVTTGQLKGGEQVKIYYNSYSCNAGGADKIQVYSQATACGIPAEVTGSPINMTVVPGNPQFVSLGAYDIPVLVGTTPAALALSVRDSCNQIVNAVNLTTVTLRGVYPDNFWNMLTDPDAEISTNSTMSPPLGVNPVSIAGGTSGKTVYYRLNQNTVNPKYIEMRFSEFQPPFNQVIYQPSVIALNHGIINTSVDTGTEGTLNTVTFTPDNDGADDNVFIHGTLPTSMGWRVVISSDNFNSVTRTFFGYSDKINVAWDGYTDWQPNTYPGIAAPGVYKIKLAVEAGTLVDTSLTVTLQTGGFAGRVVSNIGGVGVKDADINIWGASSRYTRTDTNGYFKVYGLRSGSYQLQARKPGFSVKTITPSLTTGTVDVGTTTLTQLSILRMTVTRPATGLLNEIWGNVNAYTGDWSESNYSTVHFGAGKTTADAGNTWDTAVTNYIDIGFSGGKAFAVHFDVPSLGFDPDLTLSTGIASGVVTSTTIALSRKAFISGKVTLPISGAANTNGIWVSVEAKRRTSKDRYNGGVYINSGSNNGTYVINGLRNGDYELRTFTPGYISSTQTATVSNNTDVQNVDMTLSEGGTINGVVTVQGDSTDLSNLYVSINANPRGGGNVGSYTTINMTTDPVQSTSAYTLRGIADGTYDLFCFVQNNFELFPPGPKQVVVTNGSANFDITFKKLTGAVTGQIQLPGGHSDFTSVKLDLLPFQNGFTAAGNISNSTAAPNGSGQFQFANLGTGFYTLRAFHPATGNVFEETVAVINGQTTPKTVALTKGSYKIKGTVRTSATTPFNSLDYYVNQTTPTTLTSYNGSTTVAANRIHAKKLEGRDYSNNNIYFLDTRKEFIGLVTSSGTYEIPNVPAGTYQVFNNAEMDNNFTTPELAVEKQIITVKDADVSNVDFNLQDGITISGTLQIKSGDSEDLGRPFLVSLLDGEQRHIMDKNITLTGNSVSFDLTHVTPNTVYTLAAEDFGYPRKYWVSSLTVKAENANLSGFLLDVIATAKIQLQLRIKDGESITNQNFGQLLPAGFSLNARANPYFPNGYGFANYPGPDDTFTLNVGEGTYDLYSYINTSFGLNSLASGAKPVVPLKISGIEVKAGQTTNIGTVDLIPGSQLTGTVVDKQGNPLPNIVVRALGEGDDSHDNWNETLTDVFGKYVLGGLDLKKKQLVIASPFPDAGDDRFRSFSGTQYGEVRRPNIDLSKVSTVDFTLEPFTGTIFGKVATPDGGDLILPFHDGDNQTELRGAVIILNKKGNVPLNNPLGDYEVRADADGSFRVTGLKGIYDLWVLAKNYGSVKFSNISVGDGQSYNIGTATVTTGAKLTGRVITPSGDAASESLIDTLVGVANGFADIVIGNLITDTNGSIIKYELSGFKPSTTYDILGFRDSKVISFGSLEVNQTGEKDLQISDDPAPTILGIVSKEPTRIKIRFDASDSLLKSSTDLDANALADSEEPAKVITLVSGNGTLSYPDEDTDGVAWISSDRKTLTAYYTPTSQGAFVLRVKATFVSKKAATGENHASTTDFTFYTGIGREKTKNVPNATGAEVLLDDGASFSPPAGAFGDSSSKTGLSVSVTLRAADVQGDLPVGQNPIGSSVMALNEKYGMQAYPSEMAAAFTRLKKMDVDPLSSFYDIFLPAGVSHFFPSGKEAQLCLAYDSSVTDPSSLNIYYYNPTTSEYLLESQNKSIDTDNKRICVNVAHASVFTILSSSASILTGGGYNGELSYTNFPNPFNLKSKTVTLQDPGSASASQTINGTMIKMSIPTSMSGLVEIKIYNVLGELVRTIRNDVTGGSHYYVEWDGKNDHGEKVASGTYIARATIGGANEKYFKMAVLK